MCFLVPKPQALRPPAPVVQSYVFYCNGCNLISNASGTMWSNGARCSDAHNDDDDDSPVASSGERPERSLDATTLCVRQHPCREFSLQVLWTLLTTRVRFFISSCILWRVHVALILFKFAALAQHADDIASWSHA